MWKKTFIFFLIAYLFLAQHWYKQHLSSAGQQTARRVTSKMCLHSSENTKKKKRKLQLHWQHYYILIKQTSHLCIKKVQMWKAKTRMHINTWQWMRYGRSGKEIRLITTHASGLSEKASAQGHICKKNPHYTSIPKKLYPITKSRIGAFHCQHF